MSDLPTWPCPRCRRPVIWASIPWLGARVALDPESTGGPYLIRRRESGVVVTSTVHAALTGHPRHECEPTAP